MRPAVWLCLLALAGCGGPAAPPPPVASVASPAVCRIGPDGGRPVADRGIGGTGAPRVETADRGIGGTGIIGVITGFASVCVAGEEVALPESVPAQIDGKPASVNDLRAGQVIAMNAAGPAGALLAREIVVRHVAIGPVQAAGNGMLTVAGQPVVIGDAAGGGTLARPGQWVAVSGFRRPGGMILATRIDPAVPGPVLLRGELVRIYDTTRIGSQPVTLPAGSTLPGGFPVVVTGTMQGGVLVADTAARDIADESPAAYFGPAVSSFVVEGYVAVVAGGYFINRDFIAGGGFGAGSGRGVARFDRRPEGGLVARGLRLGGTDAPIGGARGFSPAPLPGGGGGSPRGPGGFGGQPGRDRRSFGGSGFQGPGPQSPGIQAPDFSGGGGGGGFPQGPSRR